MCADPTFEGGRRPSFLAYDPLRVVVSFQRSFCLASLNKITQWSTIMRASLHAVTQAEFSPGYVSPRRHEYVRACLARSTPIVVGINASSSSKGCLSQCRERLAKSFILSKIDYQINISDMAAACSLSRSHFSRAFKNTTGLSPQQWVIQVRIERAQLLLRMSNLSLAEIGLECGFSDQSHFSKTFSKSLGVPPKHWRRIVVEVGDANLRSSLS